MFINNKVNMQQECNLNGIWKRWYTFQCNNQLYIEAYYFNGMLHGQYKKWYITGNIHVEAVYLFSRTFAWRIQKMAQKREI